MTYSNWILITNSLIAVGLSAMILVKDRDSKEGDKTNILLTLGLIFWFIANIIWAYYEVGTLYCITRPFFSRFILIICIWISNI